MELASFDVTFDICLSMLFLIKHEESVALSSCELPQCLIRICFPGRGMTVVLMRCVFVLGVSQEHRKTPELWGIVLCFCWSYRPRESPAAPRCAPSGSRPTEIPPVGVIQGQQFPCSASPSLLPQNTLKDTHIYTHSTTFNTVSPEPLLIPCRLVCITGSSPNWVGSSEILLCPKSVVILRLGWRKRLHETYRQ